MAAGDYSDSYANNQYRALQQFFKWWSDDEDLPNPMVKMSPPAVGEKVIPVFTEAELKKLLKACESRDFDHRRDFAIMSLFKDTGMRLAELAGIPYVPDDPERNDLDLQRREMRVRGKGNKERIVKFGHDAARTIDRYIRIRGKHTYADNARLWLGTKNRAPMTASGIYQMVARRGGECGVTVHPHKFRAPLLPLLAGSGRGRGGSDGAERVDVSADAAPLRGERQECAGQPHLRQGHGRQGRLSPVSAAMSPVN